MAIQTATPYLILDGQAREAIALYERALGARIEALMRFGDMDQGCPEARRDLVMHSSLRIGRAIVMLSDGSGERSVPARGRVSVALELDDAVEARRCFEALGESGTTVQPLFDSPWGTLFGIVTDEFGVSWMFDCTVRK
ncbi:MAG: VOC family protein [Acidobacteria bacterium]|nr:VOC family protein [Acidobacteriota bacterium]